MPLESNGFAAPSLTVTTTMGHRNEEVPPGGSGTQSLVAKGDRAESPMSFSGRDRSVHRLWVKARLGLRSWGRTTAVVRAVSYNGEQ